MRAYNTYLFQYAVNMVTGSKKKRMVLFKNPGSTEFADGDTQNAIVTYNMWREHRLIEIDPTRPRNFRLVDIGEEQLQRVL